MKAIDFKFELAHEEAIIPYKDDYGNAGFDVYAAFDEDYIEIKPKETKLIPTGIKSSFSEEYFVSIQERGSVGSKGIATRAGVIDSNYRGEWFIALQNNNNKPVLIAKYPNDFPEEEAIILDYIDAIAQFVILPVFHLRQEIVDNIDQFESARGKNCLGSTNSN